MSSLFRCITWTSVISLSDSTMPVSSQISLIVPLVNDSLFSIWPAGRLNHPSMYPVFFLCDKRILFLFINKAYPEAIILNRSIRQEYTTLTLSCRKATFSSLTLQKKFNLCTLQTVKCKKTHTAYYMNTFKNRLTRFYLLDRKGRFDAIDGLKGYAVILVFLYHAVQHIEPFWGIHHNPYYLEGEKLFSFLFTRMPFFGTDGSCIGVDLFFVLSGFLIYFILSKHTYTAPGFIKNRLQRLLPATSLLSLLFLFPTVHL